MRVHSVSAGTLELLFATLFKCAPAEPSTLYVASEYGAVVYAVTVTANAGIANENEPSVVSSSTRYCTFPSESV